MTYTAGQYASSIATSGNFTSYEFNGTNFAGAAGAFAGNYAANELMDWDTKDEAQGAAIGSAVGTAVAIALVGTTGPLGVIFMASFGGAFVGNIVGGTIGGLFGGSSTPPPPEAQAHLEFDEDSGSYYIESSSSAHGGNEEAMKQIGESFGDQLSNMFKITGGQLVDANGMPQIDISQKDKLLKINSQMGSFEEIEKMMAKEISTQMPFINVEGGDPYVLRAKSRTAEAGIDDLDELYENISLARDYGKYANKDLVILDKEGIAIKDTDLLKTISDQYSSINSMEDSEQKKQTMNQFFKKYSFTSYDKYVDNLLKEVTDKDISDYKNQRADIESSYDNKISLENTKITGLDDKIQKIQKQLSDDDIKYGRSLRLRKEKTNLLEQKETLEKQIESLKDQKQKALSSFDEAHQKEIDAIHWEEVFEVAEELRLDEHHYSEDFNKLNSLIAQKNHEYHEEQNNLLTIDHEEYMNQISKKVLDSYIQKLNSNDPSISEELAILKELGYDLQKGYASYVAHRDDDTSIPSFEDVLKKDNILALSFTGEVNVSIERFEELLDIANIQNPYDKPFEMPEDPFSLENTQITQLSFELNNGALTIHNSQNGKSFTIDNWNTWDKDNSSLELPNGTKINLDALLDKIGVKDGGGIVSVKEAFSEIIENDEDIAHYLEEFDKENIYLDTDLDDKITAYFGDNLIVAGKGDDTIQTGAGDDVVIGGAGSDSIDLSFGNDTVSYENSDSSIQASLKDGGSLGDAKGDTYKGVENLSGSKFDDYLAGDDHANTLSGGAGNDVLDGGLGADHLAGGEGIDLVDYSEANTSVEVNLKGNHAQGDIASGDTFSSIEGVRGSESSDGVIGNSEANIIFANEGDDKVASGAGDDIVYGGAGDDYIKGDAGNDTLYAGSGNDTLIGGTGDDILYSGEGKNTLLGEDGKDIVVYKGKSSEYQLSFFNDTTLFVKSKDGKTQDVLKDIEELKFDDGVFSIDYENKSIIKKVSFEVANELEEQNDDILNEDTNPSNQAATIATAAMIGTVAAAHTQESSSYELNYLSDDPSDTKELSLKDEENGVDEDDKSETLSNKKEVIPINSLDENNEIFSEVQRIIEFEKTQSAVSKTYKLEDEIDTSTVKQKKQTSVVLSEENHKHNLEVEVSNSDNDTNVTVDNGKDIVSTTELIEEELPTLNIPTIEFETTTVKEDQILSGLKIVNYNLDSSIQVMISGIPPNVKLSAGELREDGNWYLIQPDLEDLKIITAEHDSNDFDITIKATVTDNHGRVIQNTLEERISIEAVADKPNFEVENTTSNFEDMFIDLSISTSLYDDVGGADGEESILLSFENIPAHAILTAGTKDESTGIWYLTPDQLENLQVKAGKHISDDFTIKVTAYVTESENGDITSVSQEINVEVVAVADTSLLEVNNSENKEDIQILIDIKTALVDIDGSESLKIQIADIPEGASLNKGFKDSEGIWHLTKLELENLLLRPPLHDDTDFTIKVTAISTEGENGDQAFISKDIEVSVDAVADNVVIDLTQELTGREEVVAGEDASIVLLDIKSDFIDRDGSESVHYIIEGIPEGSRLNNGIEQESGKWLVQVGELENLGIFLKENSDKDFRLKVSAITTENENNHQETTIKYIDCKIESDADYAVLDTANTSGYTNDFIPLSINSELVDKDGSESLEIIIENVPNKAILNKGEKDADGKWHLTKEDLEGLSIRSEFNNTSDMRLKVMAITTEAKNGDTQVNTSYLNIDVKPLPSTAGVSVNPTQINEDEEAILNIDFDENSISIFESVYFELTIPKDLTLNNGSKLNDTTWKLTAEDLADLKLNTPVNYAGSFTVEVMPVIVSSTGSERRQKVTVKLPVDITPVADEVSLDVNDISIEEDRFIDLGISSKLEDLDGSERLSVEIEGIPDDVVLNVGVKEGSKWIVEQDDIDIIGFIPTQNFSGELNLQIKAISKDSNGDKFEITKKMKITIDEVIDKPILNVVDSYIKDGEALLTIQSELRDLDLSETLIVKISDLPVGATLSAGVLNDDGSYTLQKKDLEGLKVLGISENANLSIVASSGDVSIEKNIKINPIDSFSPSLFDDKNIDYIDLLNIIDAISADTDVKILINGIPNSAVLSHGEKGVDGVYTVSKDEIRNLLITGADNSTLDLSITIQKTINDSTEESLKEFSVDVQKTAQVPYMVVDDLDISISTQNGDKEIFSDAADEIYSGGGNDVIYSNSGNDVIYSDQSKGKISVSFNLNSDDSILGAKEKIIYRIKELPKGTTVNAGYIKDGELIIEKEGFDGVLNLTYPYQEAALNLKVTTNIVNENNTSLTLSSSTLALIINPEVIHGNDFIDSGDLDDTIYSQGGDDVILSKGGDDVVFSGDGNDFINLGSGADKVNAGAGDDTIVMDAEDFDNNLFINEIIDAGSGIDSVIIKDTKGVNFDMELTNVEKFKGGSGDDNVFGTNNADIVKGGAGSDTFYTKDGDDIIYMDAEDVIAKSSSFIDAGEGYDTLYVEDGNSIELDLADSNVEKMISGSGNDILQNSSDKSVDIYAMQGDDTIIASKNFGVLDGGEGTDTIDFSTNYNGVSMDLSLNTFSSAGSTSNSIKNFENIIGTSSNDTLIGNDRDNVFTVGNGADSVDGKGGNNTVVFSGKLTDYFNGNTIKNIVTDFNGNATVYSSTGTNTLTNINKLKFDDYSVYIDGTPNSPFVYNDTFSTNEDTAIRISGSSLLSNDFSFGSKLRVVGVKNAVNGSATLHGDGSVTFNPHNNYNSSTNNRFDKSSALYKGKTAGFEYIVEDEHGNRSSAFSQVNVNAVNDAPVITSNNFSQRSYTTGHGRLTMYDVDSNVDALSVSVASNLTYTTTGRGYWDWSSKIDNEGDSYWSRTYINALSHVRTAHMNVNGRTVDANGVFEYDYSGSYMSGSRYTGNVDIFDMRPFTLRVSDGQHNVYVNSGIHFHMLRNDPVILDLDGDGIEIADKYYEEHDQTLLGVGVDDAVLVWDRDNDGTISSISETDWVSLSQSAQNDLEALREIFDTNKDNLFDENDEKWEEFALWQDKNQDGLVSDDEFISIKDSDIKVINLQKDSSKEEDYPVLEYASFITKDGEKKELAAAYLDTTSTQEKMSDKDIQILKEAIKLNEQLAASNNTNEDIDSIVDVVEQSTQEELEENIA